MTEEKFEPGKSAKWLELLNDAEKAFRSYNDKCDKLDKDYSDLARIAATRTDREMQLLWANMEVMQPTTYSRSPQPVVSSRFNDRKELPRRASDIMERALAADVDADDLHETLILGRDDLVINGRGVIWLDITERDGLQVPCAYHVDRKDFRHGPARKWQEVPWVARRDFLSERECEERFVKGKGEMGRLDSLPDGIEFEQQKIGDYAGDKKAPIWMMWHKPTSKVVWLCPGAAITLDERKPWMNLTGFFPCPRPAYATLQRATLVPTPDAFYYKDQLEEINIMTERISALCEMLRLRGFYPAGIPSVAEAVEKALQNMDDRAVLVPVPTLDIMGPNASLKDAVIWLPIGEVAQTIQSLVEVRKQVIEDLYQVSGLSDIMRGQTEASETATAQQLKSQYGSIRVKDKQSEMVRLARDVIRMKAEIMAESLPIEELLTMAQVDDLPTDQALQQQAMQITQQATQAGMQAMQGDPAQAQQAVQQIQQQAQQALDQLKQQVTVEQIDKLLKDQKTRPFVIDVETDSTIEPDQVAQQQNAAAFGQAIAAVLGELGPMLMVVPQAAPFAAESIRFVASQYHVDRRMDEAIDKLAEEMENYQPPPQQAGEDPQAAQMTAQAAMKKAEGDAQVSEAQAQKATVEAQATAQGAPLDLEAKKTDIQLKQAQIAKLAQDMQLAEQKLAVELAGAQQDMQMRGAEHEVGIKAKNAEISRADRDAATNRSLAEKKLAMDADGAKANIGLTEAKTKAAARPPAKG